MIAALASEGIPLLLTADDEAAFKNPLGVPELLELK